MGSYYLTLRKEGDKGTGKVFRDYNEAVMAYNEGDVTLHAPIKVKVTRTVGDKVVSRLIDATVGQIIFNQPIPQDLGFVDRTNPEQQFDLEITFKVGKKQLGDIVSRCIAKHGVATTSEVLDKIKAQGYKYSTKSAITVAVCDAVIPPQKQQYLEEADAQIEKITKQYRRGMLSNEERYNRVIETWDVTTKKVSDALTANLDDYNPIYMMADSGARGSINQIRQLAGMRGLIANTSGTTIEIPIKANYREGLNILEYFISSRGARKGLADTALRTADSGYEAVGIIAAQSIGEPGTQLTMRTFHTGGIASAEDITQGLPRVEELFEGRRPKNSAIIAEISGKVRMEEIKRTRHIFVTNSNGEERDYAIPFGFRIKVEDGEEITAGAPLTEGPINPHDVLAVKGEQAVQNYLISEVQKTYRMQGVDINDKHIEVIVRQMMRKVRVDDPGDSNLLPDTVIERSEMIATRRKMKQQMEESGVELKMPTFIPVLLGITKASLATESFLSAASFQETTRVLTDAAIKGKVDPLIGLKENVIIGKLVPAGTGLSCYQNVEVIENDKNSLDKTTL